AAASGDCAATTSPRRQRLRSYSSSATSASGAGEEATASKSSLATLDDAMHSHAGVLLLGPAGSGKSSLLRELVQERQRQAKEDGQEDVDAKEEAVVDLRWVHPKTMTLGEFLGSSTEASSGSSWQQGLLGSLLLPALSSAAQLRVSSGLRTSQSMASHTEQPRALSSLSLRRAKFGSHLGRSQTSAFGNNLQPWSPTAQLQPSVSLVPSMASVEEAEDAELRGAHKSMAKASSPAGAQWIVLDGPLDPSWAEPLNSSLDEGRVLCLPGSYQQLRIRPDVRFVFECGTLGQASPATVTRCALVLQPEPSAATLKVRLESWLAVQAAAGAAAWLPHTARAHLERLVLECVPKAVQDFLSPGAGEGRAEGDEGRGTASAFVAQVQELLLAILATEPFLHAGALAGGVETKTGQQLSLARLPEPGAPAFNAVKYVSACFASSLAWAAGGILGLQGRQRLTAWCRAHISDLQLPETSEGGGGAVELFDLRVDCNSPPSYLVSWQASLPLTPTVSGLYKMFLVPTVTSVSYSWLASLRALRGQHTLLLGPVGCGKTALATEILRNGAQALAAASSSSSSSSASSSIGSMWTPVELRLAKGTLPGQLQACLESQLRRRRGSALGPAGLGGPVAGACALMVADDVSAPEAETSCGQRPPLEFLRQLMDTGGVYDRQTWAWKRVEHTSLLAVASVPADLHPLAGAASAGRRPLPARLLRHLLPLRILEWDRQSLNVAK
ncbi:unnamed protein product, partial [Polarella glacialis]